MPGAAAAQLRTLAAFGLVHDGQIVRQSERQALYAQALESLLASGQAFACYCSRAELAAAGGIHHHCLHGADGRAPALRLRVGETDAIAFDDGLQGHLSQDVYREVRRFRAQARR